jgi:hypothetical protein
VGLWGDASGESAELGALVPEPSVITRCAGADEKSLLAEAVARFDADMAAAGGLRLGDGQSFLSRYFFVSVVLSDGLLVVSPFELSVVLSLDDLAVNVSLSATHSTL